MSLKIGVTGGGKCMSFKDLPEELSTQRVCLINTKQHKLKDIARLIEGDVEDVTTKKQSNHNMQ